MEDICVPTLIISPNKLVRHDIADMLHGTQYRIVAHKKDAAAAMQYLTAPDLPDIKLIILGLHQSWDGDRFHEAIQSLLRAKPGVSVVVLTWELSYRKIVEATDAGPSGCLTTEIPAGSRKSFLNHEILGEREGGARRMSMFPDDQTSAKPSHKSHIMSNRVARAAGRLENRGILSDLIETRLRLRRNVELHTEDAKAARRRLQVLTPREREVLEKLTAGDSNKMAAEKLGVSPRTVEFHRAHIMEKTAAKGLPDLVRLWLAAQSPHERKGE